jgi:hypothetical protein
MGLTGMKLKTSKNFCTTAKRLTETEYESHGDEIYIFVPFSP